MNINGPVKIFVKYEDEVRMHMQLIIDHGLHTYVEIILGTPTKLVPSTSATFTVVILQGQ